jgi:hypothetical protein
MPEMSDALADLDVDRLGDARQAIATLAWTHGVTGKRQPIDDFVDAAARLSDAEVGFDHTERLLVELTRRGVISDEERFALHAAYLHQSRHGV